MEEKRSRRFEHAASVAAIAVTLPALVFTALALPIQGITTDGHNLPPWLVIALGAGTMLAGAITGAIGGRWISHRAPARKESSAPDRASPHRQTLWHPPAAAALARVLPGLPLPRRRS